GTVGRVPRTSGCVTTAFCFDGRWVMLEKQSGTTTASYTYGTRLINRSSETMLFDGHGDLRTVTNTSQTVTATGNYEAYGTLVGGTGSSATPYQYGATSGYRTDGDAGLIYIAARWYDPVVGRFISNDTDPQEHPYQYCASEPINRVDPSGHGPEAALVFAPELAAAGPLGLIILGGIAAGAVAYITYEL